MRSRHPAPNGQGTGTPGLTRENAMKRTARFGFPASAALAALAGLLALEGAAGAATRTVHVGRGGSQFVDDVSGTNVSTIQVGDTINWVWEGTMEHSVTSGTCV